MTDPLGQSFVFDPLVDTFTRSVGSGLGVSDSGHTWSAPAGFSVDGTSGILKVSARNTQYRAVVTDSTDTNVDMTGQFRLPENPTGTGGHLEISMVARHDSGDRVYGTLLVKSDGTSSVGVNNSGATPVYEPGPLWAGYSLINIRFQLFGTSAKLKVWFEETAEPSNWSFQSLVTTANINGNSGVQVLLSSTTTNTLPYNLECENLRFNSVSTVIDVVDTFSRNTTNTLGYADSLHLWDLQEGLASYWAVSAAYGEGNVVLPGTAAVYAAQRVGSGFNNIQHGVSVSLPYYLSANMKAGILTHYDAAADDFIWTYLSFLNSPGPPYQMSLVVEKFVGGVGTVLATKTIVDYVPGDKWRIEVEKLNGVLRAKAYNLLGFEPAAWDLEVLHGFPQEPLATGMRFWRGTTATAATQYVRFDDFRAKSVDPSIEAVENEDLDSPGVTLTLKNCELYDFVTVERSHVSNLYPKAVVRLLDRVNVPSEVHDGSDYEMPLDEDVVYTLYCLDAEYNVVATAVSEAVKVEVPYHRVIVRSVGQPALSRRIQITNFPSFERELRILQEADVLGLENPVTTFDVMKGMSATFSFMTLLDQEAIGLALRELFNKGQPLMFQSVMRLTGVPDFYFIAKRVQAERKGSVHSTEVQRYVYTVDVGEQARPEPDEGDAGIYQWQTLLDVPHDDWQSVICTHKTWLEVLRNTPKEPVACPVAPPPPFGGPFTWQDLLDSGHDDWQSVDTTHLLWFDVHNHTNLGPAEF